MNRKVKINDRFETVIHAYRHYAESQHDKLAYTYQDGNVTGMNDNQCISFGDLDRRIRSLAAELAEMGAQGKRAILLFPYGIDYVVGYLSCLYAAVIPVPAYPPSASRFFSSRLHYMIPDSQASFILTTSSIKQTMTDRYNDFNNYQLTWLTINNLTNEHADLWKMPSFKKDSLAFLQYTSGSTSTPKGVMVSHANLIHNIGLISDRLQSIYDEIGDTVSAVNWLPPFHDMGLIGGILALPHHGHTVHLLSPVAFMKQPILWLQAMSRSHSAISGAPNFAFDHCVKNITADQKKDLDLSRWKIVFNGAEPINPKSMEDFTTAFQSCGFRKETFYPCYGLAESSLIVSGGSVQEMPIVKAFDKAKLTEDTVVERTSGDEGTRLLVGCGSVLPDGQIQIVNPLNGARTRSDEVGELWVKSPSVTLGYWNRPDLTENTFQAFLPNDAEGPYLRTGDLGFLHDNQVFITGRLKDLIIIQGKNINPNDLEQNIDTLNPLFVRNSTAAFSVETDTEESLVLVQEVDRKFMPQATREFAEIIMKHVQDQFDLVPFEVVFIRRGTIHKTSSGKIQRRACKDDYAQNMLQIVGRYRRGN